MVVVVKSVRGESGLIDTSTAAKAPLGINPEQTPGFGPGKVEGLI
jgi:hypothetical protein